MLHHNTVEVFKIDKGCLGVHSLQDRINNFFIENKDTMADDYVVRVYEHLGLVFLWYHDINFGKDKEPSPELQDARDNVNVTGPPVGIPRYKPFTQYVEGECPNCYKCKQPIVPPDLAIPASGCSSNTFVHGSCWTGCHDGGPHQWTVIQEKHWPHHPDHKKCAVCGEISHT